MQQYKRCMLWLCPGQIDFLMMDAALDDHSGLLGTESVVLMPKSTASSFCL